MPASSRTQAPVSESRPAPELARLRDAAAVRERCAAVHRFVADGRSPHFTLDQSRLAAVAAYVADVTREAYPDLTIPYHSRWRHFSAGGVDRWSRARGASRRRSRRAGAHRHRPRDRQRSARRRRRRCAGATASRRRGFPSRAPRGSRLPASTCFAQALFSSDARQPYRVDGVALETIDAATLARHFQVDTGNPLVGVEQRSALLRRLGLALAGAAGPVRTRARAARQPGRSFSACRRRRTHSGLGDPGHAAR